MTDLTQSPMLQHALALQAQGDQAKLAQKAEQSQLDAAMERFGQEMEKQTREFEKMMDARMQAFTVQAQEGTKLKKAALDAAAKVKAAKEKPAQSAR